jgi:unsaturated chondroitin disaccharide hydrolase
MPIKIDFKLTVKKLVPKIERLFELSAEKILSIEKRTKPGAGTPVFTVKGKYTSRGWTEWTQGFQYGSALLQFDATGDDRFLEIGRRGTIERMASHVSHFGVHDHGFNNVSTYGNLLRLMREGKIPYDEGEKDFYEMALKVSGAVQAARWTKIVDGTGFIHSFNGPHSLFIDTIRSLRSLAVAHQLGHVLMGEQDAKVSLLQRLLEHAFNTARYNIYFGSGRDAFDERGRAVHEAVFNVASGTFRCPSSQQGYSPFTTWTRGQAWAISGYAEQLEFLQVVKGQGSSVLAKARTVFEEAARATADHYIENSCADGIPMWDTGAPNLHRLGNFASKKSNPFNKWEPVDSSAATIAAQGLWRLGKHLNVARYKQAALTIAATLFSEPYLSTDAKHQGLILHSVYHRPNGWDHVAPGQRVPNGESSMWGDYHARELALLLLREARGECYLTFFDATGKRG